MILSGPEILRQIDLGNIRIDPFDPKRANPASFDLTLGDSVAVYKGVVKYFVPSNHPNADNGRALAPLELGILDMARAQDVLRYKMTAKGWLLKPGIGYLMHTAETVYTQNYVPVLDGKSSIGRMFTKVHETAGYGDPNFNGQYTLEVTVVHPVIVYPGMRIAQIRFHAMEGATALYDGNYKGDNAKGPVPSRVWKQLQDEGLVDKRDSAWATDNPLV